MSLVDLTPGAESARGTPHTGEENDFISFSSSNGSSSFWRCVVNHTQAEIEARAELLVRQDVHLCLSGVVSEMATKDPDTLLEMADGRFLGGYFTHEECGGDGCDECESGESLTEVYEYWAVSEFLGKKLEADGQIVEFDFWGLVVWGRQATGQAVAMDSVFERMAVECLDYMAEIGGAK